MGRGVGGLAVFNCSECFPEMSIALGEAKWNAPPLGEKLIEVAGVPKIVKLPLDNVPSFDIFFSKLEVVYHDVGEIAGKNAMHSDNQR